MKLTSFLSRRTIASTIGVFLLLLLALSFQAPAQGQTKQERPGLGQPTTPLEKLLKEDGALNLNTGFTGSLDPAGWEMTASLGEQPRFVRAGVARSQRPPAPAVKY